MLNLWSFLYLRIIPSGMKILLLLQKLLLSMKNKNPSTPWDRKENTPNKETVIKPSMFGNNFRTFKAEILSWLAGSKQIMFGGFQRCKVHFCTLRDFKGTAFQNWCIVCSDQESNPGCWAKSHLSAQVWLLVTANYASTLTTCIFEVL